MLKTGSIAAALAVCAFTLAGPAAAAPLSAAANPSASAAATLNGSVTQVGWQRRRHCHRGRCGWRRIWVPGVSIIIGPKHRHRHHHRRHRH